MTMFTLMAAIFLASILVAVGGVAGPASGQEGTTVFGDSLVADSDTVIVVDPETGSLSATHLYEFTNPTEDQVFGGLFGSLPVAAVDIRALIRGREVPVLRGTDQDATVEVLVSFPTDLEMWLRLAVTLTWTRTNLDGDPNQLAYASPALVAIDAFAVGHGGGASSLTVEAPAGYSVMENSGLVAGNINGRMVLRSSVAVAYESHPVVLTAPERLSRITVDEIELDITVASLSESDRALVTQINDLMPILAALLPVEIPGPIEFRQGWTGPTDVVRIGLEVGQGDIDASTTVVVVSPDVEPMVVAREIAGHWLARITFDDPRISDALARTLGDAAALRAGYVAGEMADNENPWVVPLASVFAELDDEHTAAVIGLLDDGSLAYPGSAPVHREGPLDWHVLLDAVENVGGSSRAADLFSPVVPAGAALSERAAARLNYLELSVVADGWSLPPWLRVPMAEWEFDEFEQRRPAVEDLLASRDALRLEAGEIDLQVGSYVRDVFELADDDLSEAEALLARQRETLEVVAEARQLVTGDRGLLSRIGLAGEDTLADYEQLAVTWNEGDFATATRDAHDLIETIDGAVARGTIRLIIPSVALGLLFAIVNGVLKKRRPLRAEESSAQGLESGSE